jgi:dTDP-4-dehydrorhamnose 3,5-epimerase
MPFDFKPLDLPGLLLVEPKVFRDPRGWFLEMYKRSEFAKAGIDATFVQDNYARSVGKGTLRGLHYQKEPAAQGKLIRVVVGEIHDVVVDIRKGSPTFGKWAAVVLSEENKRMLWVPPGFAHGYCATSDVSEIVYKVTHEYSPAHERAIRWNDPQLAIPWPAAEPLLSEKDAKAPLFRDADNDFAWRG